MAKRKSSKDREAFLLFGGLGAGLAALLASRKPPTPPPAPEEAEGNIVDFLVEQFAQAWIQYKKNGGAATPQWYDKALPFAQEHLNERAMLDLGNALNRPPLSLLQAQGPLSAESSETILTALSLTFTNTMENLELTKDEFPNPDAAEQDVTFFIREVLNIVIKNQATGQASYGQITGPLETDNAVLVKDHAYWMQVAAEEEFEWQGPLQG